jgi:topoisomerase-4 subunit A
MAAKPLPAGEMRPVPLGDALKERYLSYALSTIMSRSLPDVRDGLKPVHRRLLYAMRELRLDPKSGFKKCARIVGDVMGKFHPHGDAAIYDAMVRLAQEFSQRYPLVDGQGNFGNVDGDGAAAMRYTEARLTEIAEMLLAGIDENAVDFRPTYDGEGQEPVVLPGGFPNLLGNGASGIAVGMATNIPPHNVDEICAALLHLIKTPKATIAKLVDLMPGPDFPTGGVLVEDRAAVEAAYASGRGQLRVRARWKKEPGPQGTYNVVVTEIPYQVQKSRLIERIAQLLQEKKLALLADVRDESAEDVRIVLEPKSRNVDAAVLMESLFRQTELETRFGLNMNVLDGHGIPRVMSLREVLQAFLDHRHEVLVRRTKHRLAAIETRLEVLDGFLIAYLNIDQVIKIIRREDDPKAELMKRFKLSEPQTEAILNMRLRTLNKLSEIEIKREHEALSGEKKDLNRLLKDEDKRWQKIAEEIGEIRKRFGAKAPGGGRRTEIADAPAAVVVPIEALIEREPITVICSEKGWIRAFKGHLETTADIKYKEGDGPRFALKCESSDKLLVFATNGRFYTIGCDKLPGGRGDGEPVKLMAELGTADVVQILVHKGGRKFAVASSDGRGFVVAEDEVVAQTRTGKQVLNVAEGVEARACCVVEGDSVAVIGDNHKLLLFPLAELPEMARGRGVILQRYKDGGLADIAVFTRKEGLSWRTGAGVRTETALADWFGQRSQAGRLPPRGFPRANRLS